MAEMALADASHNVRAGWYVEVSLEQRGRAVPPLYDGYRALFADITMVALDARRRRRVTDRIRNCAARILCFLNYQLARVPHPEDGIRFSRSHFQKLFRGDYGLDIIEMAQAVLIAGGFVFEPEQEDSTDRAFCWRINALRLQQALDEQISVSTAVLHTDQYNRRRQHVELVPQRDDSSPRRANVSERELLLSHEQKAGDGGQEKTGAIREFSDDHAPISGDGRGDSTGYNKKKQREFQEKRDLSSLPIEEKDADARGENRTSSFMNNQAPHVLTAPQDAEEIIEAFQDAPGTAKTVLAFFDRLRGYQLTGNVFQNAQEHAIQLCHGNPETQRSGYPLQAIMLTTLYLLKYDPAWQEHYERYCGRTGIPDVWAVNKWIGAKWPLALRRLLETGAYVRLDDGRLLSRAAYQAMLEREQEQWEQKNQRESSVRELELLQRVKEEVSLSEGTVEQAEAVEQGAKHADVPSSTDKMDTDAEPGGFPTLYVASLHASRLRRVLPPYFQVEVQLVRDAVFVITITNTCAEDDVTVLTCNNQVCEVLRVIQEE